MQRFLLLVLASALATNAAAMIVQRFPGLDTLIAKADAIVILRIDEHVDPHAGPDFYTTHQCFIYQSLKGEIKPHTRIALQLTDPRSSPLNRFSLFSHHLAFLTKKRAPNERTEYRTLEIEGADIRVPSYGIETMAAGETPAEQIRSLLKATAAYWTQMQLEETRFLETMETKPTQ